MRWIAAGMLVGWPCLCAEREAPAGRVANDSVEISAKPYPDRAAVRQLIDPAMPEGIVAVEVTLTPKDGKTLLVLRDDFLLRSDRDGQRSGPFAPSQIAGRGALVVSSTGGRGAIMGDESGPIWGGAPGTSGRPRRLGGDGGAFGNASESSAQAVVDEGAKEKDNPLLAILKKRVFPERSETEKPVTGLLYFPLDGKHRAKDLELIYSGAGGKLAIRFK